MPTDEARLQGADGELRPERIARLIERAYAHQQEGDAIDAERKALGMDPRRLKNILAQKKTLDALIGEELLPEGAKL
jgi:hypothetical protein